MVWNELVAGISTVSRRGSGHEGLHFPPPVCAGGGVTWEEGSSHAAGDAQLGFGPSSEVRQQES